jgi:DNA-binding NarL/FixJ family response regulator
MFLICNTKQSKSMIPIKVAIIEDKIEFRELWCDILQNTEGYVCVGVFGDIKTAVAELPSCKADIVLTDINLSNSENGIDFIRQVRDICIGTEFMMFTIFEDTDSLFESLKAGAKGYLLKNSSPEKVLNAIKELHEGGAPMSAAIARKLLTSFDSHSKQPVSYNLTEREVKILQLLAKGMYYKEIADQLGVTIVALKHYIHTVYEKLEASNRTEAVNKYFRQ